MAAKSPRASAHKFLLISTQGKFSTCTGTREQLIAAGLVHPDKFPKGRALKYFAADYTVSRVRGGYFKWESIHQKSAPKHALEELLLTRIESGYRSRILGLGKLDEEENDRIEPIIWKIVDVCDDIQTQRRKLRLKLAKGSKQ